MQVSSLMSGLQYRASGALKHADYGDGTNLNVSYNNRQLLTRYELNNVKDLTAWPYPYTTMGSQNQYHDDGRVSYTQDLRNGNFDRGYTFDHAGRLEIATSGREARGEPPANPIDSPYKQTFSYDVWGNMGRAARLWSEGQSDTPSYTNNRRSDRGYDAEGHDIGGGWAPYRSHDYDANTASDPDDLGLMQIQLPTAQDQFKKVFPSTPASSLREKDLFDPTFNVILATSHLGALNTRFGSARIALGSYKQGVGNTLKGQQYFGQSNIPAGAQRYAVDPSGLSVNSQFYADSILGCAALVDFIRNSSVLR